MPLFDQLNYKFTTKENNFLEKVGFGIVYIYGSKVTTNISIVLFGRIKKMLINLSNIEEEKL